ncbi:MAG: intradiol ring-cleavage dioxygenase [Pirellulales bacterium]|nr:intradiol ring-cleavage dioxygenase [Pirellulales bacterium]
MAWDSEFSRRGFVRGMAWGAAALAAPGALAEALTLTPEQTEGPFYPDKLPLDTDNDLLIINDSLSPAVGEITHLGGRILEADGSPIRNAMVEIWQVDGNGVYLHSRSAGEKRDRNFQGYGRFLTDAKGRYYFRTVKPVLYPGRQAPHIHFAINRDGDRLLTTQCYIEGHKGNDRDGVLRGIRDERQRESVMVDFKPLEGSKVGELTAKFDVVLGLTPEES